MQAPLGALDAKAFSERGSVEAKKSDEEPDEIVQLEEDICIHIFSVSAALVGVCLTVIGIFQVGKLKEIRSIGD